jgi:hypothetical protein
VSLADAAESDVRPRVAAGPLADVAPAAAGAAERRGVDEWWRPLLLLALLALAAEWLVFLRRA